MAESAEFDEKHAGELALRLREASQPDTVAGVARRLWFSRETTRRYFKTGRPNLNFIVAFCQTYDVTPNWLIYGVEPKHWGTLKEVKDTPKVSIADDLYRKLSSEGPRPRRHNIDTA